MSEASHEKKVSMQWVYQYAFQTENFKSVREPREERGGSQAKL